MLHLPLGSNSNVSLQPCLSTACVQLPDSVFGLTRLENLRISYLELTKLQDGKGPLFGVWCALCTSGLTLAPAEALKIHTHTLNCVPARKECLPRACQVLKSHACFGES